MVLLSAIHNQTDNSNNVGIVGIVSVTIGGRTQKLLGGGGQVAMK